jgi:hypothetical protein
LSFSLSAFASSAKSQTTIILINGNAVLVELGSKGEVYKEYINVPDYFTSYRSHESLVERSIKRVKGLSRVHKSYDKEHFLSSESNQLEIFKPLSKFELKPSSVKNSINEFSLENNSVVSSPTLTKNGSIVSLKPVFAFIYGGSSAYFMSSPALPEAVLWREEKT